MHEFLTAPHPIRSVLIANRGEIACRIIATCRKLGLRSIAVYSEADAGARHVRLADEALEIGPAAPAQSYLDIERILAAARRANADAIHPGYGFLSENARFARACEAAGILFVGPSADAVLSMGSKIEARRIAEAAGVPIVPGYQAANASLADLASAARKIGYPVMVKASAGGGGRGMRRVDTPDALEGAVLGARAEAAGAFGDDTLFIEKLIVAPRHLEVQVFGDGKGDALHFFERDCSIQRKHQKLVEEAPAPNLPEEVRRSLLENALTLARSIRYAGAGTVEFIMQAGTDQPYFLEMNTRIQVEHPVTEAICGVDLVALQLRQAAGLPLGLSQEQIVCRGHAIEVRINAERPDDNFLPATGRFVDVVPPPGIRFDSSVDAESEVSSHYDSLLAKLIAHGADRDAARRKLMAGLDTLAMPGIGTNQAFLIDCLGTDVFARGEATTAFLTDHFPNGWRPDPVRLLRLRALAARYGSSSTSDNPLQRTDGFRVTAPSREATLPLRVEDEFGEADLTLVMGRSPHVSNGELSVELREPAGPRFWRRGSRVHACEHGLAIALTWRPLSEASLDGGAAASQAGHVMAPLTGLVSHIYVAMGDEVRAGAPLVEMQAMKLVHSLVAPFDGRVVRIACAVGETRSAKTVLVEMEEAS